MAERNMQSDSSISINQVTTQNQTIIEPSSGWISLQLRNLWQYRELLYFLVWRDIKVRYKQTVLGIAWIIAQPLVSMIVFTVIFGNLLNVPTGGVPYPVFSYAGLLPWTYFATSLNKTSISLITNTNLITKVYFPRLIIPISGVLSGLLDFAISFLVFLGLMLFYNMPFSSTILLLPVFLLLAIITALGFGLWLSALNVRYRDINYLTPFLIQIWMFLTPVVYSVAIIPERYRSLLALNPMTGVVGGFRWALLGEGMVEAQAPGQIILVSTLISLLVLFSGAFFFRRTERTFADII